MSAPNCPLGDDCDLVAAYNAGVKHAEDKPVSEAEAAKVLADDVEFLMELGMRLGKIKPAWKKVWASHLVAQELRALTQDDNE